MRGLSNSGGCWKENLESCLRKLFEDIELCLADGMCLGYLGLEHYCETGGRRKQGRRRFKWLEDVENDF
jgi:hypothetical protein